MSFGYQTLGFGAGGVASPFIEATGGTEATSGNYKTHTFSSPGTFTVTNAGKGATGIADYFVVAGGGGGGNNGYPQNRAGGAGGGGGFRLSNSHGLPAPTMSPLVAPAGGLTVSATAYPIAVGAGGGGGQPNASSGQMDAFGGGDSTFSSITSTGGGGGPGHPLISGGVPYSPAGPSTGGSGSSSISAGSGGNTPPFSPVQGYNSGTGFGQPTPSQFSTGGGGGAGGVGGNSSGNTGGKGGIGGLVDPAVADATPTTYGTTGPVPSVRYFAGGGGGIDSGAAPDGGGGTAFIGGNVAANTGGGGGGGQFNSGTAPNGGSGLVVIRYQFQ